jgi:hypothetical protein
MTAAAAPAAVPAAAAPAAPPTAAMPAQTSPATAPAMVSPPAAGKKLAMDECGLHTQYKGDEYCILPPPADKGFQLHIGPSDYNNPAPEYVMQPGEENVVDMSAVSGNDKDVYYFLRQYRMRPGSHHVIISVNGRRIGGIQNLARDEPTNGMIAPEDEDVGLPLKAHTPLNVNMHFYNFSDKPIIRELWVNYWYKDDASVKEPSLPVYAITGVTSAVAHSHVVVGSTCTVTGSGRLLDLYGHRHLSNVRFSAWHTSDGKRELILDDYDAEHPAVLDFNSLTTNPAPNPMSKTLGGHSGILNLKQGDTLDFDCEIVNKTDKNFFGANEAQDDEMCIMIGNSVGAQVSGFCTAKQAMRLE